MAHVQRRKLASGRPSYRVRYIDPTGKEVSRSFTRRVDADSFAAEVGHSIRAGTYIEPGAGRLTVQAYLEDWLDQQAHLRPRSRASYTTSFRTMVYPHLGQIPIGHVKPSTLRKWQTALVQDYADGTIKRVRGVVSGAFNDAVADRLIPSSPFVGVKSTRVQRERVIPLSVEQVNAGRAAMPVRYREMITVAAGTGLRYSELVGLTVDRIDFLRREIKVDRQLAGRAARAPVFGPPKSRASIRTVPIGATVLDALARHLAKYPGGPGDLVFRTSQGTPLTRTVFGRAWKPAAAAMGLPHGKGPHQLRHFYASLLIAAGLSVPEVQERMGHASAQETLETYAHLWPGREDNTRAAVDEAFASARSAAAANGPA
jgi:integrase